MDYQSLYDSFARIKSVSFVFPHAKKAVNSKNIIKGCSMLVADVSKPSHGVGIEIGWADSFGVPIILIYKKGSKVSSSLKFISRNQIEYRNFEDARAKLEGVLNG